MRDAQGQIVYVGKAKDLKQRLSSYRVANPERMGRRHLRLLNQVTHIEFELCQNESSALRYEAKLIRELKPKFNRAGVWQGKAQFLVWRYSESAIEFSVQEVPRVGWERFGNLGGYANRIKCVLVRLIWLTMNPDKSFVQMQLGWMQNRMNEVVSVECSVEELRPVLNEAFWGSSGVFLNWLAIRLNSGRPAFERVAIQKDMDELKEFLEQDRLDRTTGQMGLL
jgi:GIY-YIG catalytic domain